MDRARVKRLDSWPMGEEPMRTIILVAAMCTLLSACNPFEDKMTSACEEAIKQRLAAPATYKRISVSSQVEPISRADLEHSLLDVSKERRNLELMRFDEGSRIPKRHTRIIVSDAANGFGVPIRATSACTYVSPDDKPDPSWVLVEIDGKTNTQWAISRMQKP